MACTGRKNSYILFLIHLFWLNFNKHSLQIHLSKVIMGYLFYYYFSNSVTRHMHCAWYIGGSRPQATIRQVVIIPRGGEGVGGGVASGWWYRKIRGK